MLSCQEFEHVETSLTAIFVRWYGDARLSNVLEQLVNLPWPCPLSHTGLHQDLTGKSVSKLRSIGGERPKPPVQWSRNGTFRNNSRLAAYGWLPRRQSLRSGIDLPQSHPTATFDSSTPDVNRCKPNEVSLATSSLIPSFFSIKRKARTHPLLAMSHPI